MLACGMEVGYEDVDSRGGHAADTPRDWDETLLLRTGDVEVIEQMSGAVKDKIVVVYGEIYSKRNSLAYAKNLASQIQRLQMRNQCMPMA